ncbi:VCBS repeat-containing protein [bacterium]|nr:VCBS repeat-containing protein [bacterium]
MVAKLFVIVFVAVWSGNDSNAQRPSLTELLSGEDVRTQDLLDHGKVMRDRRQFDQALAAFNLVLEKEPLNDKATYEAALTYYSAQRWEDAMNWFDTVVILDPQRRDAFAKRWHSLLELGKSDTLIERAAGQAVLREIAAFLKQYPWDWETLDTARDGALMVKDSLLQEELADRLLANFPNSPASYEIIAERFWDGYFSVYKDPVALIRFTGAFLDEYSYTDFRETVWKFHLKALLAAGEQEILRSALNNWFAEEPESPVPYERAVYYLREIGVPADSLLPLARHAVDLCRGWRGKPLKPVEQRIMEGKSLYAQTRLNIVQLLIDLERYTEVRLWIGDGLRHCDFGVDDFETYAPFFYFLGIVSERELKFGEAFDHYIECLVQGDMRGKWIALADSAARRLFEEQFSESQTDFMDFARNRRLYEGPVFDDVTEHIGFTGIKTSRVAWGDANHDGFDDLLCGGRRLFLNQKGEIFLEITTEAGFSDLKGITGGVWADVDMDRDLDLFCAGNGAGDRLLLNDKISSGIPQFIDVTEQAGMGDIYKTEGAAWGDLQGDGRPDLYVANYESSGPEIGQGTPDYLYINKIDERVDSDFKFERLDPDSGLKPPFGENLCGRGVTWGDFDGDMDQDIYVSNYRLQENLLWENQAGALISQASFYDLAGVDHDGWRGHSIGSEWGDFDNDGDLDLISANLAHPRTIEFSDRTCLYENRLQEEGVFRDVRSEWGIKYDETHSEPTWGDFDADGDLDLYITSIYPERRSFLYLNDLQSKTFRDVTFLAGARVTNGWGCAYSDLDNDGDLDLAVGSDDGVRIFRQRNHRHHWLEIEIDAAGSGYGTRIALDQEGLLQLRELSGGKGTTSQHSNIIYFGLGENGSYPELRIIFPTGKRIHLENVRIDRRMRVI